MGNDSLKRYRELEKYFNSYTNGEFDEDDQLLDELSYEMSELKKELNKDGILV